MKARPLHTRDDLLRLLQCPSTACERALRDGVVTVLGGFTPADGFPLMLTRIESLRGNKWYVGLRIDEAGRRYVPFWLEEDQVPWKYWSGERTGTRPLIDGDEPRRCAALRDYHRTKPNGTT